MSKSIRRSGLIAVLLIVALVGVSMVASSASAAPLKKVRFGVDSFVLGAQVHVGVERGIFSKYGIDPEVQVYSYGADTLDAVLAGRSDFGIGLDFATMTRLTSGQLDIVASVMTPDPGFHKLAVRSGITDAKDLKGKSIGIAQGTMQHFVSLRYLEVNDVPKDSVKLVPFSSLFEIVGALRAGRIDAAWVWANGTEEAKKIPGVSILTDDSAARTQSYAYLATSKQLVEKDPELVKATLQAFAEITDWMLDNMEEASKIVAARVNAPQDQVLTEMKRENYALELTSEQINSMINLVDFMTANGVLKEKLDVEQYVVPDMLKAVAPERVKL